MATIDITTQSGAVGTGDLQLQNGAPMDATLRFVTDALNTASPLLLSTTEVQVQSTLKITTNDNPYIDAEDGAGNNRFTVGRDSGSQQVNVDFASNPTGSTTLVGAIRTYVDGTNLSEVMTFREDGNVGIGTTSPTTRLYVKSENENNTTFVGNNTPTNYKVQLSIGDASSSRGWNVGVDPLSAGTNSLYFYNNSTGHLPVAVNGQTLIVGNFDITSPIAANIYARLTIGAYFRTSGLAPILSLLSNGNAQFGNETNMGAKVGIKGSGSTSATTSLLVQNSAGTNILKIADSARIDILGTIGQIDFSSYYQIYSSGNSSTVGCYLSQQAFSVDGSRLCVNVAGGSHAPSASFQVDSTTKGILPPRMTTAQKLAIGTPAAGLQVYDTTLNQMSYYNGTIWINF